MDRRSRIGEQIYYIFPPQDISANNNLQIYYIIPPLGLVPLLGLVQVDSILLQ